MKNFRGWHYIIDLVVVILGILIAFILNNWHTNIQNSRVEKQYLLSLQNDLQRDKAQLDSLIQSYRGKITRLNRLSHFLTPKRIRRDSTMILFSTILTLDKFDAHRATFEALKNSGDFNLISSYSLQKKIVDYYQTLNAKKHFDDILDNYFRTYILPFAFQQIDFQSDRFLHPNALLRPYARNLILGYRSLLSQSVAFHTKLRDKCASLLNVLNQTP